MTIRLTIALIVLISEIWSNLCARLEQEVLGKHRGAEFGFLEVSGCQAPQKAHAVRGQSPAMNLNV